MKLYLSSYRLGNRPEELLKLLNGKNNTAVIFNAYDYHDPIARNQRLNFELEDLRKIGLDPTEIDLREYFDGKRSIEKILVSFDLVWVRGGNVFLLRKALAQSRTDIALQNLIMSDLIVYGGYSAGSCVLAPTLRGIELVDDEHLEAPGYNKETIWEGLNIIPFAIAPHYRSNHPESEAIEQTVQYFIDNHMQFIALKDGEALVVDNLDPVNVVS